MHPGNQRFIRPIPLPRERPAPVDHNEPGASVIPSRLDVYSDVRRGPLTYLGSMIVLATIAYVAAISVGVFLFREFASSGAWMADLHIVAELILFSMTLLPVAAAVAAYCGIVCLVVLPCYAATVRWLKIAWGWEVHGALAAGVVAFVGFVPLFLGRLGQQPQPMQLAGVIVFGPLLATTFLQCAGAYAGYLNWRFCPPLYSGESGSRPWSFSLRQLLLLTLGVSLVLGGLSALGLLNAGLMALFGSWLVWQGLSLPLALWFGRWRRRVQVTRLRSKLVSMRRQR